MANQPARGGACLLLLLATLASAPHARQQATPQAQPTFRAGVDVIPVDVVVLDGKGVPVTGLEAADFSVTIDGRPRRIVSASYIRHAAAPRPAAPAPAAATPTSAGASVIQLPDRPVTSNQEPPGRLVMIAIDEGGMEFGGTRVALEGLKRALGTLEPADAVGLAVLPGPGVAVPFTRDRRRLLDAFTRVSGQAAPHVAVTHRQSGWAEALAYDQNRNSSEWKAAIDRECFGMNSPEELDQCVRLMENEAQRMLREIHQRVGQLLVGMDNLLAYLRTIDAPKVVILLSSGIIEDPRERLLDRVGRDAAAARASIYVLHFNTLGAPDASERRASPSRERDADLGRATLESIAGRARGTVFEVTGGADDAFGRIGVELSGYYLLGVEPLEGDGDGKAHSIGVRVARKDVTVKARRDLVWVRRGGTGRKSPADAIKAMLASPIPASELPIRAAAYSGPAPDKGKLRVLVSAEIGSGRTGAEKVTVGWALVDAAGQVRAGDSEKVTLRPVAGRTSGPLSFVRAPIVDPGSYTLRLAVVDQDGREGSVEDTVEARLSPAGSFALGDLVVGVPPADVKSDFEPPVECVVEGDRLFVLMPVASLDARALGPATAALEIARGDKDAPLLQATVPLVGTRPDQRTLQAIVGLDLLPPGRYLVRVTFTAGDRLVALATRGFTFSPAPGTGGVAAGRGALGAPRFALSDVFQPETLAPFLDHAAKTAPGLPPAVFADARAGRFDAAANALPADATDAATPFLRGLDLLARGDIEAANLEFRRSLRASPDFLDAAFFIGACYARGGKDAEAIGAWQTARVALDDQPILHHVLIDARLRRQQVEQAAALAEDAVARWPNDARFQPQLATVLAMQGETGRAIEVLDAYLAGHNEDAQALFLILRLLYDTASNPAGKPDPSVVGKFRTYAALYDAADGPNREIVGEWLKRLAR
jgi:VWFA-related protein